MLYESLVIFESLKKRASRNLNGMEPEPGYEDVFTMNEMRCDVLRKMLQEMEAGMAQETEERAPADWQKELMEHPEAYREKPMVF